MVFRKTAIKAIIIIVLIFTGLIGWALLIIWALYEGIKKWLSEREIENKDREYRKKTIEHDIKELDEEDEEEEKEDNVEDEEEEHEDEFIRKKPKEHLLLDKNFMQLSGYEFEEFISELFKRMGYKTTITPKSNDYGIDVVAKGFGDIIAIQCKRLGSGSNVSNRDIQRARGSMDFYRANKCLVVTNQDFTESAKKQAKRTKDVKLWNKKMLHKCVKRYFIEGTFSE